MIIVSSCLAGVKCRYDGKSNEVAVVKNLFEEGKAIPVCPEILGGLETPRPSCEIVTCLNGEKRIQTKEGLDFTKQFEEGAQKTLKIAKLVNAKQAILKANSPSCGFGHIYDGTFSGIYKEGNGLTGELLSENEIEVFNEKNWL